MLRVLAQRTAPQLARSAVRTTALRGFATFGAVPKKSFAESHEYAKVDGGVATVGITDYAANALGDIVFVDLPEVGDEVEKGEAFGAVESVKAASDVYAPISGEVVEINGALEDTPDLVNSSALEDGWFIKVKMSDEGEVGSLMDEAAYAEHTKE